MADIRALIVDDEALARERIRTLLAAAPGVTVLAECSGGRDAVEAIIEHQPDLVFLDVQMPDMDGFRVDRKRTRLNPSHYLISYAVFCLKTNTVNTHTT